MLSFCRLALSVLLLADAASAYATPSDLAERAATAAGAEGKSAEILLVNFLGADDSVTHKWRALNDPVMGGQSFGKVAVENNVLNFTGSCRIVPSLKAPGFITAQTSDFKSWPDVSGCKGIKIMAKANSDYSGYRVSFGRGHPIGGKFFAYGYKSHFTPSVGSFGSVYLPFEQFTDFWDDATGEPIHTCAEKAEYCPDDKTKQNLKTMSIWAEGVEGEVGIEIDSVSGYGCKAN